MAIELAAEADFSAFLRLAEQVEELFGPMVADQGFHDAVRRNLSRGSAIVTRDGPQVIGGLFLPHHRRPRCRISWLVVDEAARSRGIGRGLLAWAFRNFVEVPAVVDVVTFGIDHPGARVRHFYERLGFHADEMVEVGPEGGSRQIFRLELTEELPEWVSG